MADNTQQESNNIQQQEPTIAPTAMMGDGPSRCDRHDFTANSTEEWNKHCEEFGHTDTGVVCCQKCGAEIMFERIPYQHQGRRGKDIQLKCQKCIDEQDDLNRQILSQAQAKSQPSQELQIEEVPGGNTQQ